MLEDRSHLRCTCFWERRNVEFSNWQGYLVCNQGDDYYFFSMGFEYKAVFGADSDYNTLALSLLQYMLSLGLKLIL